MLRPDRPCSQHGSRGCSECQPRKERKIRVAPHERFAALAAEAGYEAVGLRASFSRGRKTFEQKRSDAERWQALRSVMAQLKAEGFTLEAIGAATNRTRGPGQRVAEPRRVIPNTPRRLWCTSLQKESSRDDRRTRPRPRKSQGEG